MDPMDAIKAIIDAAKSESNLQGGKRRTKKTSKKASKKGSKKVSKRKSKISCS